MSKPRNPIARSLRSPHLRHRVVPQKLTEYVPEIDDSEDDTEEDEDERES